MTRYDQNPLIIVELPAHPVTTDHPCVRTVTYKPRTRPTEITKVYIKKVSFAGPWAQAWPFPAAAPVARPAMDIGADIFTVTITLSSYSHYHRNDRRNKNTLYGLFNNLGQRGAIFFDSG